MILTIFQYEGTEQYTIFTLLPILFIVALILLKIGLVVAKAEEKTSMKWVLISFGIQVGLAFFISSPLMLIGIAGGFEGGPDIALIIIAIIVSCFVDLNVLNAIHKLGMKRAFIIFVLIAVPLIMVVSMIFYLISFYV